LVKGMLSYQLRLIMHSPMHTPVMWLHAMHFPNRNFDLNTLFCVIEMENALQCLYKLLPGEACAKVLDAWYCDTTKILTTLLFTAIIVQMTGWPMALEQWLEQFHKKNADDSAGTIKVPYLPDCVLVEVNDFTDFVLRTCTDSCGRVSRITNWMGHGNSSSIQLDLKKANHHSFCCKPTGRPCPLCCNQLLHHQECKRICCWHCATAYRVSFTEGQGERFWVQVPSGEEYMYVFFGSMLCHCALTNPIVSSCFTPQWLLLACYFVVSVLHWEFLSRFVWCFQWHCDRIRQWTGIQGMQNKWSIQMQRLQRKD
jgi:hypothetical protein